MRTSNRSGERTGTTASVTVSPYNHVLSTDSSPNALAGTWNSLGQDLSDQKLFDALGKLAARNIHVSNLIIDDNWQSVEHAGEGMADRQWLEFEAERRNFPLGLKGTVGRIREKYPHIQHVAVWHALFGNALKNT